MDVCCESIILTMESIAMNARVDPVTRILAALAKSWQSLTTFSKHGSLRRILTKILLRSIVIPRSNLTKTKKFQDFKILIKSSVKLV